MDIGSFLAKLDRNAWIAPCADEIYSFVPNGVRVVSTGDAERAASEWLDETLERLACKTCGFVSGAEGLERGPQAKPVPCEACANPRFTVEIVAKAEQERDAAVADMDLMRADRDRETELRREADRRVRDMQERLDVATVKNLGEFHHPVDSGMRVNWCNECGGLWPCSTARRLGAGSRLFDV